MAEGPGAVVTLADAMKRLNKLTGLSVDEIQQLVSAQSRPPGQMLRVPLYDKKRHFRADLIAALDVVFSDTEEVTGSIPVSPTKAFPPPARPEGRQCQGVLVRDTVAVGQTWGRPALGIGGKPRSRGSMVPYRRAAGPLGDSITDATSVQAVSRVATSVGGWPPASESYEAAAVGKVTACLP